MSSAMKEVIWGTFFYISKHGLPFLLQCLKYLSTLLTLMFSLEEQGEDLKKIIMGIDIL